MEWAEYQEFTATTAMYPGAKGGSGSTSVGDPEAINYCALGFVDEILELIEVLDLPEHETTLDGQMEEAGDCTYYLARLYAHLGLQPTHRSLDHRARTISALAGAASKVGEAVKKAMRSGGLAGVGRLYSDPEQKAAFRDLLDAAFAALTRTIVTAGGSLASVITGNRDKITRRKAERERKKKETR